MCVCVKEGLAGYGKETQQEEIQPDDGQNEGNIKSEHSKGICTGVSCFFKHLPAAITLSANNCKGGISIYFKYSAGECFYRALLQMKKNEYLKVIIQKLTVSLPPDSNGHPMSAFCPLPVFTFDYT